MANNFQDVKIDKFDNKVPKLIQCIAEILLPTKTKDRLLHDLAKKFEVSDRNCFKAHALK